MTTTVVQPQPFNDALQALGTAQARESVTITAKVSDVVTRPKDLGFVKDHIDVDKYADLSLVQEALKRLQ